MKTNKRKEAYLSPDFEILEVQTCDVIAASGDLEGGQIEDINFENWNLN